MAERETQGLINLPLIDDEKEELENRFIISLTLFLTPKESQS
jgi:hypothetical protein